jgi:Na+/proline symporter
LDVVLVAVYLIAVAGLGLWFSRGIKTGFGSIFEAFQTFLSFFQGPLLALLLLGMLTKRTTGWGGVAGMLVGVGTAAVLNSECCKWARIPFPIGVHSRDSWPQLWV